MRLATVLPLLCAIFATASCQPAQDPAPATSAATDRTVDADAGADPGAAATPAPAVAAAPESVPGTDAAVVADHTGPGLADPRFEARSFAGTFSAGDRQLVIEPDGRYGLRADGARSGGSWSLEAGSGLLLLDPDAKDMPDQRFALPSHDELAPQDGAASLHRDAAGGER